RCEVPGASCPVRAGAPWGSSQSQLLLLIEARAMPGPAIPLANGMCHHHKDGYLVLATTAPGMRADAIRARRTPRLQLRGHGLDLGVGLEDLVAHLAAPAGLLVAAERQRGVEDVVAVDPDGPGTELLGQCVGLGDV